MTIAASVEDVLARAFRPRTCVRGQPVADDALLWRRRILGRLPVCLDSAVLGSPPTAPESTAVLIDDVGQWLVPITDEPVALEMHLRFLDHMAALHAAFWDAGLQHESGADTARHLLLSPWTAQAEPAIGSVHAVPRLIK
jgi:hypothetical protein